MSLATNSKLEQLTQLVCAFIVQKEIFRIESQKFNDCLHKVDEFKYSLFDELNAFVEKIEDKKYPIDPISVNVSDNNCQWFFSECRFSFRVDKATDKLVVNNIMFHGTDQQNNKVYLKYGEMISYMRNLDDMMCFSKTIKSIYRLFDPMFDNPQVPIDPIISRSQELRELHQ